MTTNIEIETYPAEDKWSPETTQVRHTDSFKALGSGVQSMSLETYHAGTPSASHKVNVQIAGDSEAKRSFHAQQAKALLAHAGLTDLETKTLGSHTSIVIDKVPGVTPLVTIAHALGVSLEGKQGETTSAQLSNAAIDAIEQHYLTTKGMKPSEAGMVTITTDTRDAQWHAIHAITQQQVATIDAHMPRGPISAIREEVASANADGQTVMQTSSSVFLREWGMQNQMATLLRAAGLKTVVHEDEGTANLSVEGTADQVATVLGKRDFLSAHVAQEIAESAAATHPQALDINTSIARDMAARGRRL